MAAIAAPTVGRDAELNRLAAMLDELDGDGAACFAVEGEPGIGKTRLLSELRASAEERGMLVLGGSAAEFERDLPFGVWVDALDAYVASREPRGDPSWPPGLLDDLAGVLPSLRADGGTGTAMPEERHRVHRAIRRLLELIAADRPLVLVLDDLHWSDGASIELIAALLRRTPDAAFLMGLGCRTGKVPAKLRAALTAPSVVTCELKPLSEEDAAALMDADLVAEQRAAIYGESGGNPFYTLQLARAAELPARTTTGDRMALKTGVPRVVAAALIEEIGALSPTARALLGAGAVAGDPFDPELAYEIGQLSPAAGVAALDELLGAGLLHPTDVPRLFVFRHPLVRRAVYESVKGGWRISAHSRAAAALAASGASAAARAHHVEQSAAVGDAEAIALLLEAGDASAPRDPAGAARWYAAALRLVPARDIPTRVRALVSRAGSLQAVGDLAGALSSLLDAVALLPPQEAETRAQLISGCAALENFMGRHEQARGRLLGVLDALDDKTSPEAVVALLDLAGDAFFVMEVDRMRDVATQALDAARSLGDERLICAATAVDAHACALSGDLDQANASRDAAARRLEALSEEELGRRVEDLNRLCWAEFYLARYEDSIAHAQLGVAVSRATGQGQFVPLMTQVQALGKMMLGRLPEAAALQDEAIEGARIAGVDYLTCAVLVTTSQIAMLRGDADSALVAAEESVERAAGMDPGLISGVATAALALAMLECGASTDKADAVVAATGGWDLPRVPAVFRAIYQETKTRAELARGHIEAAEEAAVRAESAAADVGLEVIHALAARARAAVLLAAGEAAAGELAERAIAHGEAARTPVVAARARALAGQAMAAAGRRAPAVAALKAAEAELDACGATRARDEVRRELRKLGARAERRGPAATGGSGLESLSKREREIAELVTDRKTNREVAAELFLSEKTIESHLRSIFQKLEASSRVEVARTVERERSRATTG